MTRRVGLRLIAARVAAYPCSRYAGWREPARAVMIATIRAGIASTLRYAELGLLRAPSLPD